MSLRGVWRLCNCRVFMHCFGSFLLQAMFLSLQVFAFKVQNMKLTVKTVKMLFTCIAGAFTIMHKKATFVIYLVLQSTPTYINEMAGYSKIAPKLEKQNTRLKPEMIGCYYCFSPRRILRLPRYSLTFGFPWTRPSVHSPWYQWHNCSFNMTRIQALFWLGNTSNWQGLLRCASPFLFRARFLWRSAICKLAMKWYPMRMCTRWLCPFKNLVGQNYFDT